jgi:hypothetical protein
MTANEFGIKLPLPPELEEQLALRALKKKAQFIKVPMAWNDRLRGANGQTHQLALRLLHHAWRRKTQTFVLANKTLATSGISQSSKWRALRELEQRGLIEVENRRPGRSPIVRLNLLQGSSS